MVEFIKLREARDFDLPLGESLAQHESLIKEMARVVLKITSERGRNHSGITFICDDASSLLLATVVANTINNIDYVPKMQVSVLSTLIPFSNQDLIPDTYEPDTYEYSNLFLVKETIVADTGLIEFKEQIEQLVDTVDESVCFLALLTLTPHSVDGNYRGILPLPIVQTTNIALKEDISDCLSSFLYVVGL